MSWNGWQQGKRCGKCGRELSASQPEKELQEYVRSLGIDFIANDRQTVLNQETGYYLELDLWFPAHRKGIEFNGTYWHGLEMPMRNDKIKREFCDWKGIDLLVVEEMDWSNRREMVEENVREFLL
jgi:hypothetical protein